MALARGSKGYLAAYAAGVNAIVAVIGTNELNIGLLHLQTREVIERIAAHSPEFRKWTVSGAPAPPDRSPAARATTRATTQGDYPGGSQRGRSAGAAEAPSAGRRGRAVAVVTHARA